MAPLSVIIIMWLTLAQFGRVNSQQPCSDAINIGDPRRSSAYSADPIEPFLCDRYINEAAWYRFDSYTGSQMREGCVRRDHCGTDAPIWMNDTHPNSTYPGPKSVQVCSPNAAMNDSTCCEFWNDTIQVQWCAGNGTVPDFYVYNLKRVPGCDMAYCAGSLAPCPSGGQIWNPVNQSCSDQFPVVSTPALTGYMNVNTTNCTTGRVDFRFTCRISSTQQTVDDGARFDVNLTFSTHQGLTKVANSSVMDVTFASSDIAGNFPPEVTNAEQVHCQVSSYWSHRNASKSDPVMSNAITVSQTDRVVCSTTSPSVATTTSGSSSSGLTGTLTAWTTTSIVLAGTNHVTATIAVVVSCVILRCV